MEDADKVHDNNSEDDKKTKSQVCKDKINEEDEDNPSKSSSRTSMLSKVSSGRNSPDGQEADHVYNPVNVALRSSSTEFLTQKHSTGSRFSGIEVNPLFDVNQKRRKSLSSRLFRQMSFVNNI